MAGGRALLMLVVESTLLALAGREKLETNGSGGRAPDAPARAASVCQLCTAAAECGGGGASGGRPIPGGSPTPDPALCADLTPPSPLDLRTCPPIASNPAVNPRRWFKRRDARTAMGNQTVTPHLHKQLPRPVNVSQPPHTWLNLELQSKWRTATQKL